MGIEKSKPRARDVLYSPWMDSEIQEKIARCSMCQQHQKQNAKEPMIPSQLPSKPWEKVATELFTRDKSEYLIIVDYHSRSFEVAKLPDTKSNSPHPYQISFCAPWNTMWFIQWQRSSVLIQGIWVIHETVGIQTSHQSTLPTSKWARWKISSKGKESANQSKARQPWSISRIIRIQEHTYWWGRLTSATSHE